eukprot:TRINITY_DN17626_c1_g1_i1.p1 TRINITY_DN17626_c1_g1~~TRINITY_DN17626_c1_g1_i1.p1  ORF type:complete len:244 (+),score=43.88 TRINITY_DN17626_c1_g1_i1:44-733(+)
MAHRASIVASSWDAPLPIAVSSSVDSRKLGSIDHDKGGDPVDDPSRFYVVANGLIETCSHPGASSLYCRFKLEAGPDWTPQQLSNVGPNIDEGVTQVSERAVGYEPLFAWNLPFSVCYSSTSPWGWPKLSLSVYTVASADKRNPPLGYGWCHVPTKPGRHEVTVPLFKPVNSMPHDSLFAMFRSHVYEFRDNAWSKEENREVMRVEGVNASVKVTFNVITKGMAQLGYH